jgi:thymidine kinase
MEIYYGPMYSGKTEHLIEKVKEIIAEDKKCLVVKYLHDVRYGAKERLSSKSGLFLESGKFVRLVPTTILPHVMPDEEYIFIDEGQFYDEIFQYCIDWLALGKKIYITSLSGDYKKNNFGNIYKLLPHCDKIHHLLSDCYYCFKPNGAAFTCKIVQSDDLVDIGSEEKYRATCRACYDKYKALSN